jgi:uncharacterized membrane protein YphA (DoxX/SURF4 family)
MFASLRYSQLSIRIGLAIVYLWFGIDKFIQPDYWINAWMPVWAQHIAQEIGMSATNVIILIGIFEVLVATSLVTGFFMRVFAVIAIAFLATGLVVHGFNEVLVRDVGLIAGLLALAIWPERRYV